MQSLDDARYRLRLAEGFLLEARQDLELQRWRSCVDNSQLTVENAAKAVLALLGPVGHTHEPAQLLRQAVEQGRYPEAWQSALRELAACAELLGLSVHIESDYGDEVERRTPWELFGEEDARRAVSLAETAASLARRLLDCGSDGQ